MRTTLSRLAMAGAFVSLVAFTAAEANAQRGRGGGHGGATSMSRGGGGHASAGTGFSRGGSYSRPAGGASASQRPATGNRSNINTGNVNRGNINTGNVNRGNINTGNINTGNVNINVDNHHNGWGGWHDYPIAAGVAIGAVAVATRAVVLGSAYYALPPACSPYAWQSYTYYYCGGAYYRPQYEGDTIVYIAVAKPK